MCVNYSFHNCFAFNKNPLLHYIKLSYIKIHLLKQKYERDSTKTKRFIYFFVESNGTRNKRVLLYYITLNQKTKGSPKMPILIYPTKKT